MSVLRGLVHGGHQLVVLLRKRARSLGCKRAIADGAQNFGVVPDEKGVLGQSATLRLRQLEHLSKAGRCKFGGGFQKITFALEVLLHPDGAKRSDCPNASAEQCGSCCVHASSLP